MAQYAFGAGNMYVTQLQDASGNAISNPTPYPLMSLQSVELDFAGEVKELFGQNQFPVAIGRAKLKLSVKVKPARIIAAVWNSVFFGQTLAAGTLVNYTDTSSGKAIPTTPFTLTVSAAASSATVIQMAGTSPLFIADLGVINAATGNPFVRVASAPATGQYTVAIATGVATYVFATADAATAVLINYQFSATSTTAQKQTVTNLAMGLAPTFKADMNVTYLGKNTTLSFPSCVANKMGMSFKNDDFMVPEFNFEAFDPGNGQVFTWSTSE